MANRVDPDETAHYELSHLNLHNLQRYLCWFAGMKRLTTEQASFIVPDVKHYLECIFLIFA